MKKIVIAAVNVLLMAAMTSCLDYDNYDGPKETLMGKVVDQEGNPLWVESGGGIRIKVMDVGWSDNPLEQYYKVKMDGTYQNTKVFASTYDIVAEGPFVPLVQNDDEGNISVDKTVRGVKVKGKTTVDFVVEPFLKVTWVGEPTYDSEGLLTVNFNIERGTDNPAFMKEVYDIGLFVSTTQYAGENNYDVKYSTKISDSATATSLIGQTGTLKSDIPLPSGRTYYIRVGARMNYSIFGGITYNYTDVKEVVVP